MTETTRKQLARLLADAEPDERRRAAEELSGQKGLAVVAALAAAMEDEHKGVRDAAFRSLHTIGGINVARAIVEYIGDPNITIRNLASDLLMKLGSTAIPAILPFLADESRDVRKFAVDILGSIGSLEPVDALVPLVKDPDENVVVSVIEALGNIKASSSLGVLFDVYDSEAYTRTTVAEALGKIGDRAASDFLLLRFQEALGEKPRDGMLLFTLIESLGLLGTERVLNVLIQHVGTVAGRLRSALLHAMVLIAERYGRSLEQFSGLRTDFLESLKDPEPHIRQSAIKILLGQPGAEITAALVRTLGTSPELDAQIMSVLPGRPGAFLACLDYLEHHRSGSVKNIIALMGQLVIAYSRSLMREPFSAELERGFERAFILIADQWGTADEETRGLIIDVLFRLDGDNAVEFLDAIMNDPDPWLRMHVIEIIAAISDPRAPEFIARFLADDDEMVRDVAMDTLQSRGYNVDVPGQEA
jgi:HEAT repeat protein